MFSQFLNFVLEIWSMVIQVLESTDLGGFTYMQVLIAVGVISLIVGLVIVNMEK